MWKSIGIKEESIRIREDKISRGTFPPFETQAQYSGCEGNFETKGSAMLVLLCKANASSPNAVATDGSSRLYPFLFYECTRN